VGPSAAFVMAGTFFSKKVAFSMALCPKKGSSTEPRLNRTS
jgi:hypothetical protein